MKKNTDEYSGFNEGLLWPSISIWNDLYPSKKILLIDGVYLPFVDNILIEYFLFVENEFSDMKVFIISINKTGEKFNFIGYDCGYIDFEKIGYADDNDTRLLFSFIKNDFNVSNDFVFSKFSNKLNSFNLFENYDDVIKFLNFRKSQYDNKNINIERAFNELKINIFKIHLYETPAGASVSLVPKE